jgi:hypothetical protein
MPDCFAMRSSGVNDAGLNADASPGAEKCASLWPLTKDLLRLVARVADERDHDGFAGEPTGARRRARLKGVASCPQHRLQASLEAY